MKIPNLDNVHVIFHHQLPTKESEEVNYWIGQAHVTKITKHTSGHTICKIYRGEELIGEGRADCSSSDNFSRPYGRALSLKRALEDVNKNLNIDEKLKIFQYVSELPSSKKFFSGRKHFIADVSNKSINFHLLIPG